MTNANTAHDLREASPNYARVIYCEGLHRIALCKDGVQYLIQRGAKTKNGIEYRAKHFCVTASAAARDWRRMTGLASSNLPKLAEFASDSPEAVVESGQTFAGQEIPERT